MKVGKGGELGMVGMVGFGWVPRKGDFDSETTFISQQFLGIHGKHFLTINPVGQNHSLEPRFELPKTEKA